MIYGRRSILMQKGAFLKNYSLLPVIGITALGGLFAGFYVMRLALRNPDVSWNKRSNPEPWQEYENKQYKFYSNIDHEKYQHPRPRF
ncbi:cytochrome c oxidase subunit NDUFA4-like protein [Dinothrombium tinctorium]|uniref:Cytochrome c oxidase subunit NDUFA4-like protein n=1 Tax=Dinothrombium tinctorium TaxID=1965070 RepID=A0A3S4R5Q5_9ACAR|nr:cytochrome c oxidase subunit NDUFA4-like protein [Dinothrombium tinctorium]